MASRKQPKTILKVFPCVKTNSLDIIAEVCIAKEKYLNIDFQKSWVNPNTKQWENYSFGFSLGVDNLVTLQQALPDILAYAREKQGELSEQQRQNQAQSGMQSQI